MGKVYDKLVNENLTKGFDEDKLWAALETLERDLDLAVSVLDLVIPEWAQTSPGITKVTFCLRAVELIRKGYEDR